MEDGSGADSSQVPVPRGLCGPRETWLRGGGVPLCTEAAHPLQVHAHQRQPRDKGGARVVHLPEVGLGTCLGYLA